MCVCVCARARISILALYVGLILASPSLFTHRSPFVPREVPTEGRDHIVRAIASLTRARAPGLCLVSFACLLACIFVLCHKAWQCAWLWLFAHTHTHTHTHTHRVLRAAAVFRLRNRRDELIAAVSLPKLAFRVGESVDVSLFFDQSQVTVASVRWRDVGWRERTRCNHVCMCVCVSVRVSVNLFA